MKNCLLRIAVCSAALANAGASVAEPMNFTITVGTNERNGICYIYLPSDPANSNSPELEISVKPSNLNVNVGMSKLTSEAVSPRLEHDAPLTLTLGNGKKLKTDGGAFRAGFYYKHSAWWNDSTKGAALLSYLKDGTTIKADFDGLHYGPIQIQQSGQIKNYGYTWLKGCITRNGGTPNF